MISPNTKKDKLIGDMAHMICNVLDYFNRYDLYLQALEDDKRRGSHEKLPQVKAKTLLKAAEVQREKAMGRIKKVEKGWSEWGKR